MIPLVLAAALACTTSQGWRLELMGPAAGDRELSWVTPKTGLAQGGYRMTMTPGGWYELALDMGEAPGLWPAGQQVVAILPDSSRVLCEELFATSPDWSEKPVDLGRGAVMLDPSELRRVKRRRGSLRLLVRFPGLERDPVAIEARR